MLEGKTKIVGTFMGVPHSQDISKSKAAILGIPFDCGLHPDRVGARLGPSAIRQQSVLVRPYQPPIWDTNLLDELRVVDCGDVDVVLGDLPETFDRITESLGVLLDGDVTPITFGGDGSVTLPQLRAFQKKYPDLVVLHFDAHTDTYPDVDDFGQYEYEQSFVKSFTTVIPKIKYITGISLIINELNELPKANNSPHPIMYIRFIIILL